MPIDCSKCGKPAVYLRRYTAEQLCKSCLGTTTIQRVQKTINKSKMLSEKDRIVVAVSGGKDSAVLLDVLFKIEQDYPDTEIITLTIDEGIKGYRNKAMKAAQALSSKLGLKLEVRTFQGLFGHSLDEIIGLRTDVSMGACSYCGVLRRHAINAAAQELNADVVATGHNLDDEAQTVMMNMLRGDSRRIGRTNRSRNVTFSGFIPRVKPIMELSERDIVAYTYHLDLPYHDVPCPYSEEAYRNDLRAFLNEMEYKRPGTLFAILRSAEAIAKAFEQEPFTSEIQECESCGTPTSMKVCKACSLLAELGA